MSQKLVHVGADVGPFWAHDVSFSGPLILRHNKNETPLYHRVFECEPHITRLELPRDTCSMQSLAKEKWSGKGVLWCSQWTREQVMNGWERRAQSRIIGVRGE